MDPALATEEDIKEIRKRLRSFVSYDLGRSLRKALKIHASKHYLPEHSSSEYLEFMNQNACDFTVNHPQADNHPFYWLLFSVPSQHVSADCIEECLDKAMKAAG
jgi:hypothetical protein